MNILDEFERRNRLNRVRSETVEDKLPKLMKNLKHFGFGIFIFVTVLVIFLSSFYTVSQNEYAYVTRFSKMIDIKVNAGPYFKIPFFDSVKVLPADQRLYDIPPSDVITADKQTLVIDNYAIWKITDPEKFMRTIASITEIENRISASGYSAVKNTFGSMTREQIVSSDPDSVEKINKEVTEEVNRTISSYGVMITTLDIKRINLPDANAEAVYQRMITERNQIADTFVASGKLEAQKIRNETDKQISITMATAKSESEKIMGEAENEYMGILSEAYSTPEKESFYKFVRGLDALKLTMGGNKQRTLILDDSSYIIRMLLGESIS